MKIIIAKINGGYNMYSNTETVAKNKNINFVKTWLESQITDDVKSIEIEF